MRLAIIGRSELLLDTAHHLARSGHEIALVVTAPAAREYRAKEHEFGELARAHGSPFHVVSKLEEIADEIAKLDRIDVGVSVNFPTIIRQPMIDLFPLGILNAHGGDLPRYKGNACQAWAILQGEARCGLCIHRMVGAEVDSGDIIARDFHAISEGTTVGELWDWMESRIPSLFEAALAALTDDPSFVLETQSADPAESLRCYPRRPEDGEIHWSGSALGISRLVNASGRPYSGAYTMLNGEKLTVWRASLVDDKENFLAVPGQIVGVGEGWVRVATGLGKLQLDEVEFRGERTSPDLIIRSIRSRLG